MKNLLWIVLALIVACLVFGLLGSAISANTSSATQAIAQIEAQRSMQQIISGSQTIILLLVGLVGLLVLSIIGLGIALLVKNRQQSQQQQLPGSWAPGPKALWGRKNPQLTQQQQMLQLLMMQQMLQNGQKPQLPGRLDVSDENDDWFGGMFG